MFQSRSRFRNSVHSRHSGMTRWARRLGCALVLCVVPAWATAALASTGEEPTVGHDLFIGALDLKGRISSHTTDLPAEVVRCVNCHAAGNGPDVPRSVAPRLTGSWLGELHARRGGPLTRYDSDAFCTLLRKGRDPAYIVISVEMPRYDISDKQCRALWNFLNQD